MQNRHHYNQMWRAHQRFNEVSWQRAPSSYVCAASRSLAGKHYSLMMTLQRENNCLIIRSLYSITKFVKDSNWGEIIQYSSKSLRHWTRPRTSPGRTSLELPRGSVIKKVNERNRFGKLGND